MTHAFGGPWTQIKLDMLRRYLEVFNQALQFRPSPTNRFRRFYIDAFAGTGECEVKTDMETVETIAGSAKLAIETVPLFDNIHLIDRNEVHVAELKALAGANARVHVHQQDANVALQQLIRKIDWKSSRGVLFLDPYGMTVPWSTLELAASTKALDVWYLFPLSAIYRQAANDFNKIDEGKLAALDSVLGTKEWREHFYKPDGQAGLIEGVETMRRDVDPTQIAAFVEKRLALVFKGWVSPPLILRGSKNAPLFALFCCISNPSPKAVDLSRRMAQHILGKFDTQPITAKSGRQKQHLDQGDLFA